MKKYLLLFAALCCMLGLLSGCAGQEQTDPSGTSAPSVVPSGTMPDDVLDGIRLPTAVPDYFELLCENTHAAFYLRSSGMNFMEFRLFSAEDLEGQVMTLCSDLGQPFEMEIPRALSEPDMCPFYVFAAYQDLPWKELAENEEAFSQELERYELAYDRSVSGLPRLYTYPICCSFQQLGVEMDAVTEALRLRTLSVTIGGQTKTYELADARFLPEKCPGSYGGGLIITSFPGGVHADPSGEGSARIPKFRLEAKRDMVLQGLSFAGDDGSEVFQCILEVKPKTGGMYSFHWDGSSPVEIDEGSALTMEVSFRTPALAEALSGTSVHYLQIHYTVDGEEYVASTQTSFLLYGHAYDIYAEKVDGVDLLPYYLEYYNVVKEEQ